MTDLVDRLRDLDNPPRPAPIALIEEAVSEIERLRAERDALRLAVRAAEGAFVAADLGRDVQFRDYADAMRAAIDVAMAEGVGNHE